MKPIAVFTVAVLLITFMTPPPAMALDRQTAFNLAFLGAAIIVQVLLIAANRPQPPKDHSSGLRVSPDTEEDTLGGHENVAVVTYAAAKREALQGP